MSDELANEQEPENPIEARRSLWRLDMEYSRARKELRELRRKMPGLNKAKRVAYARAFLTAEGPMDIRKQKAELAQADAVFDRDACEQEIEACQDYMWELKGRAENMRAINSNLKEEIRGFGGRYDGHP